MSGKVIDAIRAGYLMPGNDGLEFRTRQVEGRAIFCAAVQVKASGDPWRTIWVCFDHDRCNDRLIHEGLPIAVNLAKAVNCTIISD